MSWNLLHTSISALNVSNDKFLIAQELVVKPQAAQAHSARSFFFFFFFNLYANVQRAKRDAVTADIYYYITAEFGYAKRDLRLAACGVVVLQRLEFIKVCMGKNGNRHYS